MEAVNEVANLSTKIHAIASRIMTFQDDWVNLSDDYQHQVDILASRLETYQRQVRLHGQPAGSTMMKILKKAEETLQKTASRLDGLREFTSSDRCCSHIRLWCAKLRIILFPDNIEQKVKKVNEDIDDILKILKEEAEIRTQMREANRGQSIPTQIDDSGGYVPIRKTESAVIAAIEDPQGDRIILLHGGFGKGKSTIARYMVHRYGHGSERDTTEDRERKELFESVIWVSCASCSKKDIPTKQSEILQDHSPDSIGASPTEDKPQQNRIAKAVKDFFSSKKVLVILDDVTDASFLHEMWKAATGGAGVKYLVTSQWENICSTAGLLRHSRLVKMGVPTHYEALKILASLVDLEVIPTGLQWIANEIIRVTDKNPLAMACVASHFKFSRDKTDKQEWKDALTELHKLLGNKETKIVLDSTPRSLWAAMTFCVNSLETTNAMKILLVMYSCKVVSVPEAVLRIFYARMEPSNWTFGQTRDELVMRELLKPAMHSQAQDQKGGEPKAWALGSLVKFYVKEYIIGEKEKLRSLIGKLVGEEGEEEEAPKYMAHCKQACDTEAIEGEKSTVAIVLCALYFDQGQNIIFETVKKAMTQANIDYSKDNFNDLKRQAILPVIHLLEKPAKENENWKESDVRCARQVLLTYMCKSQLDDDNICHLLKLDACSEAQLATLKAVTQICQREERPLFNDNNLNFLQVVLHLIQEAAFRMLRSVCWKAAEEKSTPLIIDTPGVLSILCNSLVVSDDLPNFMAEEAATALWNLSDTSVEYLRRMSEIMSENGALFNLLQCLFKHEQPLLQKAATVTLGNLVYPTGSSLKLVIANQDGALAGLAKLLSAHDKPDVQEKAARTLRNLACTNDNSLKRRIAEEQGVLIGLVECAARSEHPDLQKEAIAALGNLACSTDCSLKLVIANQDGALVGLAKLLSAHDKPNVQEQAARTLLSLAATEDNSLKRRIADEQGVLIGLVECATRSEHPDVQKEATAALASLAASTDSSVEFIIANQDGALVGLAKLLSAHDKPDVQELAACTLRNLASTEDNSLKRRIAEEQGVLIGLVECLAVKDRPVLQNNAGWALHQLALSEDVRALVKGTTGLSEGLSTFLADGVPPDTQHLGARALTLINPTQGKEASLTTGPAYLGRAEAFIYMGMYVEALPDLDKAIDLLEGTPSAEALYSRSFTKTKLGDLNGALEDANESFEVSDRKTAPIVLQERGILKRLRGDLEGALADLNEASKLDTDNYERLKHRGFVKFLLKDEEGARVDAHWALRIKPDLYDYGNLPSLGRTSVEYLGYKLT